MMIMGSSGIVVLLNGRELTPTSALNISHAIRRRGPSNLQVFENKATIISVWW